MPASMPTSNQVTTAGRPACPERGCRVHDRRSSVSPSTEGSERMFASIRRYRLKGGSMDDLLHLVDTDFAETIAEAEGFVAYEVIDLGDGELMTLSVFHDFDAAMASDDLAFEWVRSTLSPQFDIERTDARLGEIAVSRAMDEML